MPAMLVTRLYTGLALQAWQSERVRPGSSGKVVWPRSR